MLGTMSDTETKGEGLKIHNYHNRNSAVSSGIKNIMCARDFEFSLQFIIMQRSPENCVRQEFDFNYIISSSSLCLKSC